MSMIEPLLSNYIDLIGNLLRKVKIRKVKFLGIEVDIDSETTSIDDRIKKIEIAKQNLIDGLSAIEELKKEAEINKKEAESALLQIESLRAHKSNLEDEISRVKQIITTDVTTFKMVAGIPSDKQIRKERITGFISGVIASVVATGIVSLIILIFNNWTQIIDYITK